MDSGNLAPQADKTAAIVEAMSLMQYDLMGVGPQELTTREAFLDAARTYRLPVVSVSPFQQGGTKQAPPYIIKEVRGKRIGFTSAFALKGDNEDSIAAQMPRLKDILRKLRAKCDIVVLLSHLGQPVDERLAREVASERLVDVIIGGTQMAQYKQVRRIGATAIAPTSVKGQGIGVLRISFEPSGQMTARAEVRRIALDLREDQEIAQLVKRVMRDEQKRNAEASMKGVRTSAYAPASRCGTCHAAQLADWRKQQHARAYDTLAKQNKLVAKCLPCHSEHYRRTRRLPTSSTEPRGVQCSSCHGSGVRHAGQMDSTDVVKRPAEAVCRSCHTHDRDPEFDYAKDLLLVDHKP